MRVGFGGVLAVVLMAWFITGDLHAQSAGDVRELRTTPETRSVAGADYTLRTVPFSGSTVTLIDVQTGVGDWTRPDAAHLPALPAPSSPTGKDTVQWFYGGVAGWMAAPTGWRVQRAAIGADGNARYTFVAPEGAGGGWIAYSVIPACEECSLREAEALLPGAGEALATRHDVVAIQLGQTNPVMSWQSRPDDCTALFRYRTSGLTVHAAVLSSVSIDAFAAGKGDLALADVYAALPANRSALADFVVNGFRASFAACRSPGGWKD